ncbi:MAG: arginase [Candidatus Competibacteraceae bacterium]|nr:arginase [Candidatus Competibacteraceae bacterium]
MKSIKLIEVRSELGAGTRGASLGIEALKLASLEYGSYFFGKYKSKEIRDNSRLLFKNPVRTYAKRIRGVIKIFERQAKAVSDEIKAGRIPIVISGDHSSAGGTIAGVKMAYPKSKIGVIWIDAHADLHSPYTTPSGNIHGMPLASALGIDFQDKPKNPVKGDTVPFWDVLKNVGGICPKITPDNLVFVGLRDMETEEIQYIRKHKVKIVKIPQIHKGKIKEICNDILTYLGGCDYLYVSFDIDSLDSSVVKGTGTPVPNGLTVKEAKKLLTGILKDPRVCCFEITEINPLLDAENRTASRVFPIFRDAVNAIEKRLKKAQLEKRMAEKITKSVSQVKPAFPVVEKKSNRLIAKKTSSKK